MQLTPELRSEYESLYARCKVNPEKEGDVQWALGMIASRKPHYVSLSAKTGVPWEVIAVIHGLEASFDMNTHLHNGDSLSARTWQVPAGRPVAGHPPFTWEESALDALGYDGAASHKDWSIAGTLYFLEAYNGWGYRSHAGHRSPYLWSMTSINTPGKYVADGVWSETAISAQVGCCAMLKELAYGGSQGGSVKQATWFQIQRGDNAVVLTAFAGSEAVEQIKTVDKQAIIAFLNRFPGANNCLVALPTKAVVEVPSAPSEPEFQGARLSFVASQYESGPWAELIKLKLEIGSEVFDVASGAVGCQALRKPSDPRSFPGNFEPIPQGNYEIGSIQFAGDNDDYETNHSAGLGPVWVPLSATFSDDRGAFGLHLDGNISSAPGSAGCVVVANVDDLKRLVAALRKYDPKTLQVQWNL